MTYPNKLPIRILCLRYLLTTSTNTKTKLSLLAVSKCEPLAICQYGVQIQILTFSHLHYWVPIQVQTFSYLAIQSTNTSTNLQILADTEYQYHRPEATCWKKYQQKYQSSVTCYIPSSNMSETISYLVWPSTNTRTSFSLPVPRWSQTQLANSKYQYTTF